MENEEQQITLPEPTLRETLEEQFDAAEKVSTPAGATPETPALTDGVSGSEGLEKPGRTAGRLRDEQGRLLPGKAEVPEKVPETVKSGAAPTVVTPSPEAVPRPSSWKKEMWDHWEKLPPEVAKYLNQRESEFAKGVSTYKQEYENARPVMEALAPHMPLLQQHGIDPGQQVARYMHIHKTLALGSDQEKLGVLAEIASNYKIPLEQLFVRGQDGQVYLNPPQPQPQAPDFEKVIESKLVEREAQQAARQFMEAKDATGNPVHPHFETVRQTMSQLLAAGIAQDLDSAYQAALRLPAHAHLYEEEQQQRLAQTKAEDQRKLQEAAQRARGNSVSVRSSTPSKTTSGPAKGLRGQLEEAFDQAVPGRV